ncbi:hypothetical protein GQ42DRAFT_161695 [Ramicandelaber brevisporus]|nr:hypothetical protein GQ42DRAFT_161695 [Ramicandelaber brevisporus]
MHTLRFTGLRDLVVHLLELLGGKLSSTPDSSSHFRLLDLPADLLEYLALYFDGQEGVRVLTVSSAFHAVFARSVWRVLYRKAVDVAEPTRSEAYARYGRLVRKIDLAGCLYAALDLHNWLELFPNTTVFGTSIHEDMSAKQKQLTFDSISGFHGLRVFELYIDANQSPFDLDTLAALLIARNQDHTKQPVRQVDLWFSGNDYIKPWAAVHRFVDAVAVLSLESLCVYMNNGLESSPTPAQFAALCPHLVRLPYRGIYENVVDCYSERNRNYFGMDRVSSTQPMCPLFTEFHLEVCCASSDIYDYSDITPANFPQLELLNVKTHVCTNHAEGNEDTPLQKILSQHWPSVMHMRLNGALHSTIIDALVLYNSHLTSIAIDIGRGMVDESGVFLVERVLEPFPKLSCLLLKCSGNIILDTQWIDVNNLGRIRSSELRELEFKSATITAQVLKLMMMLPGSRFVQFSDCAIDNESAAIAMLKQVQEAKAACNSDTGGGDVDDQYPCSMVYLNISNLDEEAPRWSCELVLAYFAVMSQLHSVALYGYSDYTINAVKERFPSIEIYN